MNSILTREPTTSIGITPLLAYAIGLLATPLFRQLPWRQSELVVLLHPPKPVRKR